MFLAVFIGSIYIFLILGHLEFKQCDGERYSTGWLDTSFSCCRQFVSCLRHFMLFLGFLVVICCGLISMTI
jgi:hypothetical protein